MLRLSGFELNSRWVPLVPSGEERGEAHVFAEYLCKGPCKGKSYETICENIVSRYQTLVSSLPREAVFRRRRPKAHFMTGRTGSPVMREKVAHFIAQLNHAAGHVQRSHNVC